MVEKWVEAQGDADAKLLLHELLSKDSAAVKSATISRILGDAETSDWPTITTGRTCQKLDSRAEELHKATRERERKLQAAAVKREATRLARERQERMKEMVNHPKTWLRKAEQLVAARGVENYETAAEILNELREALGTEDGGEITRKHAAHLAKKYPTLNRMKSSLMKRGLLE